ncbi:ubiquinone/menaquinone biosynthesis C-methylase UbiE [Paenibacillus sp. 4624]|uniref:Class I SAM-dependent methyltransferase n=1 Tax=Paenibacillus amylolyticus TaxID=1451 RepID=A0A5M9WN58_PAEAM|nr:class I SAM-dependent methyltransferase [Paenibacillus amylolyticus]KAA8782973.1 class I SAM-dependent methyltransferase [Paenibacillus amylolyticus]
MPINFHDKRNRMTYTTRTADASWLSLIEEHAGIAGKEIVDIGCGGGIYTKALAHSGAAQVTGVDFSNEMLKGAARHCENLSNVTLQQGNAYNSGLPDNTFDIVLERALIHHLHDLGSCFQEAKRILKTNGVFIIQDRTPEDCLLPGDEHHIRGYFFEKYPELIGLERSRRHEAHEVQRSLDSNGFVILKTLQLWETRYVHQNIAALNRDLAQRTGRSILHELTDRELSELIMFINCKLKNPADPIIEKDSWTLWIAVKK